MAGPDLPTLGTGPDLPTPRLWKSAEKRPQSDALHSRNYMISIERWWAQQDLNRKRPVSTGLSAAYPLISSV